MRTPSRTPIKAIVAASMLLVNMGTVQAGEADTPPPVFEKIWSANTLYDAPDNETIQSFKLVGRYHGQYWSVDADQGEADGWENRRMIFGFNTQLYQNFKLELQIYVEENFSPAYDGLYVGFIEWFPDEEDVSLQFGRLDYVFNGLERTTSSKRIATFERSQLVNQLMPGEVFGFYGKSELDFGSIQGGLFTGATNEEFGDFDSGMGATAGIEIHLPIFFESGSLHLDYLYNDGDKRNNAFEFYRDVASLWHQGQLGAWDVGLDLTYGGHNYEGRGDVWGFTLLPIYELSRNLWLGGDSLQLAMRYHYSSGEGNNDLSLQRRYELEVTQGIAGDHYESLYAGLNYLLYDHKLKLMAGLEYADMEDAANDGGEYSGLTYFAGLRLYF